MFCTTAALITDFHEVLNKTIRLLNELINVFTRYETILDENTVKYSIS